MPAVGLGSTPPSKRGLAEAHQMMWLLEELGQ